MYDLNKIKPSFDENRQKLGKVLPLSTPFNVLIDSSEACNFSCQYCFRADKNEEVWGYAAKKNNMPWNVFTRIVDQILEFPEPVKQISLSGHGEPLCNRKVPDMVRYIKEKGISSRISLHTNASLLDEEYVKDLTDSKIDRIVVSLQGMTEEKYKQVCGASIDYNYFFENLKRLSEIKTNTQLHIKIADVALEAGEEKLFYEKFSPIADRVFVEKIVPIWKDMEMSDAMIKTMCENKYGAKFPYQNCCPVLFHTLFVTPSGEVYPCTQLLFPESLGNVCSSTLLELWNGEKRKQLLRKQLELQKCEACNGCYIKNNSIFTSEDLIDEYRLEILERL